MFGHAFLAVCFVIALTTESTPAGLSTEGCGDCIDDTVSMLQVQSEFTLGSTHAHEKRFESFVIPYTEVDAAQSEISHVPAGHALGEMAAYEPRTPVNNELFVFLPGANATCTNYSQLLETVGGSMLSLCLPYDNVDYMTDLCAADPGCWYEKRLSNYNGSYLGVRGNNVVGRLHSALDYLVIRRGSTWAPFVAKTGLKFNLIRFSGHSQGAAAAATVGYFNKVARVVMFSGPCERTMDMAFKRKSEASRFFAMASSNDKLCHVQNTQLPAWKATGIVSQDIPTTLITEQNMTAFDSSKSQTVISMITAPACESSHCSHDSTAINKWPSHQSPYTKGLWQKLVGI